VGIPVDILARTAFDVPIDDFWLTFRLCGSAWVVPQLRLCLGMLETLSTKLQAILSVLSACGRLEISTDIGLPALTQVVLAIAHWI